ncbi:MAG: EAL domain-containing protein [Xenococcaceae cyanobacterium MO_188.B29]|nr:EAL domain-containing protein [Xenococcaceae cyanobacterium MO_188.B29]
MTSKQQNRHILVIEDPSFKKTIILDNPTYSVGRHSSNDIVFSSAKTSRYHATFLRRTDVKSNSYSYWILDGDLQGNRSRNGIFVNNKKCLVHELKHGDIVKFSNDVQARYHILSDFSEILENIDNFDSIENNDIAININQQRKINSKETIIATYEDEKPLDNINVAKLASFAELSPHPIIEIDLDGNITYLNSAAIMNFKNIYHQGTSHPLLKGLLDKCTNNNGNLFVCEVQVSDRIFQQNAHYLPENKVIRSYLLDLTEKKQLEEKLKQKEELYQNFFKQTTEGIILVESLTRKIIEVNHSCCEILGYSAEEMLEMTLDDLIWDRENIDKTIGQVLAEKKSYSGEYNFFKQNNSTINLQVNLSLVNSVSKEKLSIILRPVKGQNETVDFLEEKISNLPNKNLFKQQLVTAIANANRSEKLIGVMYLNLVPYTEISQTLDKKISNQLLFNFSERLKACLRTGDTVTYAGEDRFALLLPEISGVEEAAKIAQRIIDGLQQSFKIAEHQLDLETNIGIAIYPQNGDNAEALMKNAEIAFSRAKVHNDRAYEFYSSTMNSQASVFLNLENLLQNALEKDEFLLYYQPQVNVNSGNIQGIEALLRWDNPELGLVSPASFIKLAEQTGLIIPIGEWVLRNACLQIKMWQAKGIPPFRVSVNLSSVQFRQPNLPALVAQILSDTELEANLLELEISASTLMENGEYSSQILHKLRDLGVNISIDDFTSGFSCLHYLKRFPFDTLKIDQSFVKELRNNPQDLSIISALVELGKGFNLRVVAEGVETRQQIELLRNAKCEQMQGFWFSRPLAAEDATKLLPFDDEEEENE